MPDVKTPPLIVLDTNVLVSGLLKRNSPPGQVLDLILSGAIWLALDARIIDEYSRVLKRPSLKIPSVAARNVLGFLIVTGERVPSEPLNPEPPLLLDPDDLPFAETAVNSGAVALVTGNQRHFAFLKDNGLPVLNPTEFLARLDSFV